MVVIYCTLTALVEEPARMIIMEKASDATSMQGSFSAKHVVSKMQETSFSSSSMSEVTFESMSASSMTSMTSERMLAVSSGSMMAMSSHSHVEGSSIQAISHGRKGERENLCFLPKKHLQCKKTNISEAICTHNERCSFFLFFYPGIPPKIEAAPQDISIEPGKVLSVACAFTGEPTPCIEWSHSGKTLSSKEESGRLQIENFQDVTTLFISAVKETDAGAYTLKLSNEFGSDTTTVNVSIRSM